MKFNNTFLEMNKYKTINDKPIENYSLHLDCKSDGNCQLTIDNNGNIKKNNIELDKIVDSLPYIFTDHLQNNMDEILQQFSIKDKQLTTPFSLDDLLYSNINTQDYLNTSDYTDNGDFLDNDDYTDNGDFLDNGDYTDNGDFLDNGDYLDMSDYTDNGDYLDRSDNGDFLTNNRNLNDNNIYNTDTNNSEFSIIEMVPSKINDNIPNNSLNNDLPSNITPINIHINALKDIIKNSSNTLYNPNKIRNDKHKMELKKIPIIRD